MFDRLFRSPIIGPIIEFLVCFVEYIFNLITLVFEDIIDKFKNKIRINKMSPMNTNNINVITKNKKYIIERYDCQENILVKANDQLSNKKYILVEDNSDDKKSFDNLSVLKQNGS